MNRSIHTSYFCGLICNVEPDSHFLCFPREWRDCGARQAGLSPVAGFLGPLSTSWELCGATGDVAYIGRIWHGCPTEVQDPKTPPALDTGQEQVSPQQEHEIHPPDVALGTQEPPSQRPSPPSSLPAWGRPEPGSLSKLPCSICQVDKGSCFLLASYKVGLWEASGAGDRML